eukprot:CAMPEP_0201536404 /NCGR_PEP_ID=MMETSP0161_2-20130828/61770_1 /ASSEMBLY_ACC=CAM_ASM_000251 /TAXON_ID=180227 /ORGANISM="Neoparamoeba aestuarina, Strain SoJaBio B1-5/56/2" /LENGTH=115 /DNA_ID=CAMNT_0047942093 /DNA_START=553 /DNA_END=897 /DNA_ORIENTATION=+
MNKDWELEDGAQLHQVIHGDWDEYVNRKDESFGDYVTLVAICQLLGVSVVVVTSVEGDRYILYLEPIVKRTNHVIRLSHYGAFSFSALQIGRKQSPFSSEVLLDDPLLDPNHPHA